MQEAVERAAALGSGNCSALLLGVTPGIVGMEWPEGTSVFAVDGSWPMVEALWPVDLPDGRYAVCADWRALPLRSGCCDLVIGDGSMISMSYPQGLRSMAGRLHAVLKERGTLILRCYVRPAEREHPEEVFEDLLTGSMPSFHHFKLRLLMAMQRNVLHGVAVSDVYEAWERHRVRGIELPSGPGWEEPVVETIEYYRDSDTVYWFPTLEEFRSTFCECFEEVSITIASGYLSERCPILVFRAR